MGKLRIQTALSALLVGCAAAACVVEDTKDQANRNARTSAIPTAPASPSASASPAEAAGDQKLGRYVGAISRNFDTRVQEALKRIDGDARRLLAVRGYLRAEREVSSKWAWTEEEIARYQDTDEYKRAVADVEKVTEKFAELNPGYSLYANTKVRSLEDQIKNWNGAGSVSAAGDDLLAATLKELSDYEDNPSEGSLAKFERFLEGYSPSPRPTVAVPGLSPHGQMRAFDFQVKQGDRIIAGTTTSTAKAEWDEAGWTAKLGEAVAKSGGRFTGPLTSPQEPWHYTYQP
jgi:hypothetical protein